MNPICLRYAANDQGLRKRFLGLVVLPVLTCLLLVGCYSTGAAFRPVTPPPSKGVLYIYRKPSFVGAGGRMNVMVSARKIGTLGLGGYHAVVLPPGDVVVTISYASFVKDVIATIVPGKATYVCMPRFIDLQVVPESVGAAEVAKSSEEKTATGSAAGPANP